MQMGNRHRGKQGLGASYHTRENWRRLFRAENHSDNAEELTRVSSDVMKMHQTSMDGDIMRMRRITSVHIEGKGSVEFAPGGNYVTLVELKRNLNVGDDIQVRLHFLDHEDVTLTVPMLEQGHDFMNGH
jgi:copper(I)-binding protein